MSYSFLFDRIVVETISEGHFYGNIIDIDAAGWRHDAMNEALRGFNNAEQEDALLREIRINLPACTMERIRPDRTRLLCFLDEETEAARNVLSHCTANHGEGETDVYLAWYEVVWRGVRIELALCPGHSTSAAFCIGSDRDATHRFADALSDYADRPIGRCLRYSQGWENATDLDEEIGKTTWSDVVLPPTLIKTIRESVEGFVANKGAFADLGFAWKRGILLIGPPGTGKTMVFKAIASSLPELPLLYVRDLEGNRAQRESIKTIFERARNLAPCILTFEDMDGLVTSENRTQFLNEMDGFESNEGMLIIASSNHPGKIDEALLKRPSRFDRVFHIGLPALDERVEYCVKILTRPTLAGRYAPEFDPRAASLNIGERSQGFTPAYLKEAILSAALELVQDGIRIFDKRFEDAILAQVTQLKEHLLRMNNPDQLTGFDNEVRIGLRRQGL